MDGANRNTGDESQEDPLEERLAGCIESMEEGGEAALEAYLADFPDDAPKLRRRLDSLKRMGLLHGPSPEAGRIGPYRVLRTLGSGGMGQVLLAEDERDGTRVALKLGPRRLGGSPEIEAREARGRERFVREAQALRHVEHPGIVRILEVGEQDGQAWFSMVYVQGVPLDRALAQLLETGPPGSMLRGADLASTVPQAKPDAFGATWAAAIATVGAQVARALHAAHQRGIVHRDVKPSNLLLRADGQVQLLDFGLAHLGELPTLTLTGEFAGTPYYVAPEQVQGSRGGVDARADVFALGVTLFEAATLERPFAGETPMEVLTAISTQDAPALRRVAPHLPTSLELVVARCLEKDRRHRYPNMGALADDLDCVLAGRPLRSKPTGLFQRGLRSARRRPWRALAAVLGATLLIGIPAGLFAANVQIRRERDQARMESEWRGAVVEHLVGHFERTGAEAGTDEAAKILLERGVRRIAQDFGDQPRVRAALLHASARAFLILGQTGEARPLLDRAFGMLMRSGDERGDVVHVLADLGTIALAEGDPGQAKNLMLRALELCAESAEPVGFERRVRTMLARAEAELGAHGRAREILDELEPAGEGELGAIAAVWAALGQDGMRRGAETEAREALVRALELHGSAWSPNTVELARLHGILAGLRGDEAAMHGAQAERLLASLGPRSGQCESPFVSEPPWAPAYEAASSRGVAALQASKLDEAHAAFAEAFELRPNDAIPAYNLACVEASAGRLAEAVQWLRRAKEAGYASALERMQSLERDSDLAPLRADPASRGVFAELEDQWRAVQSYRAGEVLELVESGPGAENGIAGAPLLVVVHDRGARAEERAAERWRGLARGAGAALLLPHAPYCVGANPEEGAAWAPDERAGWRDPASYGAPIVQRLRRLLGERPTDRARVWIAGEGGGARIALQLAHAYPGLIRGVLLVDPELSPVAGLGAGRRCRALGVRLAVSIRADGVPAAAVAPDPVSYMEGLTAWLAGTAGWGESVRVEMRNGDRGATPDEQIGELLGWIAEDAGPMRALRPSRR